MEMLPIKSSWLEGAHYDPKSKVLTVQMKNGTYTGEVSPETYEAFAATFQVEDSSGKFFNTNLRAHMKRNG